jgi:hypothetical protein
VIDVLQEGRHRRVDLVRVGRTVPVRAEHVEAAIEPLTASDRLEIVRAHVGERAPVAVLEVFREQRHLRIDCLAVVAHAALVGKPRAQDRRVGRERDGALGVARAKGEPVVGQGLCVRRRRGSGRTAEGVEAQAVDDDQQHVRFRSALEQEARRQRG